MYTNEPLINIETRLDHSFIRTHRSYLVNITHINRIEPSGNSYLISFKNAPRHIAFVSKKYIVQLFETIRLQ
ncbi:LytTR family transcriptional regulator DNA-binding domain-containing protein [Pseudomonas sp. 2995-1]|uniref:LytTR family transcriptional regulator DNA-binding domain-containing protein n=1 Tax=Pseudomonas sp. 2995-1 TaxID=1712679 RepID=UPI0034D2972C